MSLDISNVYLNSMETLEMFFAFAVYHTKPYNPYASASFHKYLQRQRKSPSRIFHDISFILRTRESIQDKRSSVSAVYLLLNNKEDPIATLAFYDEIVGGGTGTTYNEITTQNDVMDALKSVDPKTVSFTNSVKAMSIAETCFFALNNYLNPMLSVLFARWLTVYQINLEKYKLFDLQSFVRKNALNNKPTPSAIEKLTGISKSLYLDLEIEINEKIPVCHVLFPSIETELYRSVKHVQSAVIHVNQTTKRSFNVAVEGSTTPTFLNQTLVILGFPTDNKLSEVVVYSKTKPPADINLANSSKRENHTLKTPLNPRPHKYTYNVDLNWSIVNTITVSGYNRVNKVNIVTDNNYFSYANFNPIKTVSYNIIQNSIRPDYYSYLFSQFSFPKYKVRVGGGEVSFVKRTTGWQLEWNTNNDTVSQEVSLELIAPSMFVNSVANMMAVDMRAKYEFYLVSLMYLGLLHTELKFLFQELGDCCKYYLDVFSLEETNYSNTLNLTQLAATSRKLMDIDVKEFTETITISIPQYSTSVITKASAGVKTVTFKDLDVLGCKVKITCSLFIGTVNNVAVYFLLFNFTRPTFHYFSTAGVKRAELSFDRLETTKKQYENLGIIKVNNNPLTFNTIKNVYEYSLGTGLPYYGYFVTSQFAITLYFKTGDDEVGIELRI